jgi:DNA-binding NtrC family response regulator
MQKYRILICDDEEGILSYLKKLLRAQGMEVETFSSGRELLQRLREEQTADADLLLQDMKMPDMDGIQILREVKKLFPALPVIMMTAFGTIDAAVESIKLGAYDYVTKPFPKEKIFSVLANVLERGQFLLENQALKVEPGSQTASGPIIFKGDTFRKIYDLTLQVAESEANILILGESGTGKELIAGAIHAHSKRKNNRILSINCAALSDSLFGSQLFGHMRGAFTGAFSNQKGLLEEADGSTLFMDEIADMSLPIQAKLLRVIQERDFIPVGSTKAKTVDVRLVAATNKDLDKEVRAGRFREDLYYRLNVITISLPPLRERREDIEALVNHFLVKHSKRMQKQVTGISVDALQLMHAYAWPGNIRELENVVERAVILARENEIAAENLPLWKNMHPSELPQEQYQAVPLETIEQEHIRKTLEKTGYNKSRAAEILGITRKTLDRKINEYTRLW